jgi:hypothetical protein
MALIYNDVFNGRSQMKFMVRGGVLGIRLNLIFMTLCRCHDVFAPEQLAQSPPGCENSPLQIGLSTRNSAPPCELLQRGARQHITILCKTWEALDNI